MVFYVFGHFSFKKLNLELEFYTNELYLTMLLSLELPIISDRSSSSSKK